MAWTLVDSGWSKPCGMLGRSGWRWSASALKLFMLVEGIGLFSQLDC